MLNSSNINIVYYEMKLRVYEDILVRLCENILRNVNLLEVQILITSCKNIKKITS